MPTPTLCPECKNGKHQNCDGVADLTDDDIWIDCECYADEPHPIRPITDADADGD